MVSKTAGTPASVKGRQYLYSSLLIESLVGYLANRSLNTPHCFKGMVEI